MLVNKLKKCRATYMKYNVALTFLLVHIAVCAPVRHDGMLLMAHILGIQIVYDKLILLCFFILFHLQVLGVEHLQEYLSFECRVAFFKAVTNSFSVQVIVKDSLLQKCSFRVSAGFSSMPRTRFKVFLNFSNFIPLLGVDDSRTQLGSLCDINIFPSDSLLFSYLRLGLPVIWQTVPL